jgi:hypothetical protein
MLSDEFRVDKLDPSLLPNNCQYKMTDMWFEDMGQLSHGKGCKGRM